MILKTVLSIGIFLLTYLNGIYNPKSIIIASTLIAFLSLKSIFNQKIPALEILTINIYLVLTLFLSTYSNLGMNEILLLITSFTAITLKDFFYENKEFIAKLLIFLCSVQLIMSINQVFNLEITRSYGFFVDSFNSKIYFPNAFALFNLITLGFATFLNKNFQKLILTISYLNIYLSQSRGALIAYFIILTGHLIIYLKSKKNLKNTLINISLIIGVILTTSFTSLLLEKDKIDLSFSGTSKLTSINERLETFSYGVNEILKSPLKINGSNSYIEFSKKYQQRWLANAPHPHNFFVKYWSELGGIFIILFGIFAVNILGNLSFKPNNEKFLESISILAIIFHNSIDYNLNFTINIILFFILLSFNYWGLTRNSKSKLNNFLIVNVSILIIITGLYLHNYQKYRVLRDNINQNNQYINFNFENSILMQLQKANSRKGIIPKLNLEYFIENSQNLNLNNFELAKYFSDKDLNKSQNFINKAITLNPRNNWDFYKFVIENNLQTNIDIKGELENYLELAQNNIHYTSNSKNIDTAIEVCKLIQANNCELLENAKDKFKK